MSEFLGMSGINDRQWAIFKCSAITGFGLSEGL
ncbi:MAG: ADP-ribosylation factor-like protein [bacterium]